MIVYADASVLAALALNEPTVGRIAQALDTADAPWCSDFGLGETYSAVAAATRRDRASPAEQLRRNAAFDHAIEPWRRIATESDDIKAACLMVRDPSLVLRLPDAIHLAIARRLSAHLMSLDRQQIIAANVTGVPVLEI